MLNDISIFFKNIYIYLQKDVRFPFLCVYVKTESLNN